MDEVLGKREESEVLKEKDARLGFVKERVQQHVMEIFLHAKSYKMLGKTFETVDPYWADASSVKVSKGMKYEGDFKTGIFKDLKGISEGGE